jgi:hypothetical protein
MRLVSTYGVWHTEARELPNEDLPLAPAEAGVAIIKHYLGCVRFDAWHPPFKAGWVSVGVPPEERG